MTTDKPVADVLSTQGKGMPENSAPPQTIIGTEPNCSAHYDEVVNYGSDLIIWPKADDGAKGFGEGTFFGSAQFETTASLDDLVRVAEENRYMAQAEAMVNLAVGLVMTKISGLSSVTISPKEIADFSRDYRVQQEIGEDGSHIITVVPKE